MFIPRFWSKIDSSAQTPDGGTVLFSCRRGSEVSQEDALAQAQQAAAKIAERIRAGEGFPDKYGYGARPMCEEVLREIPDERGGLAAAITRNAYGSLVLNTARVMFIDVDFEPPWSPRTGPPGEPLGCLFGWLFGGGSSKSSPKEKPDVVAARRLGEWLSLHPDWGVRVYRTHAGLRYLVAHALFEPAGPQSEEAMAALDCDAQYRRLCRAQKSFRARLSPKPWRCGVRPPPVRFPWETQQAQSAMRAWEAKYNAAAAPYATCELVSVLGSSRVDATVAPLVQLHDAETRVGSGLPLA
ncbi:MAG: hypothetical protein HYS13_19905 [Planctomycetia bacterium]|nr:hypothetical protein [Planctomycetia bacterium]